MGELSFKAEGLYSNERIIIALNADDNYTRWFTSPPNWTPPRIPTTNYGHYTKSRYGSGQIDAYDAPDDNTQGNHAVAWSLYEIDVLVISELPGRSYDATFELDLRDANWVHPGNYADTEIIYHSSSPHLTYNRGGTYGDTVDVKNRNTIWGWWGKSQNRVDLLVPVTATTNFCGIPTAMEAGTCGQIKMDGVTYNAPKTLNWGWTTSHTITAFSYLYIGGKKYFFQRWDDGSTQLTRNLTIDDQHSSYTYTSIYSSLALSLEEPNDLKQSRIVPSADKALDEDLQKAFFQEEFEPSPPNAFVLLPNHPNPFNPITIIQYQLAEDSQVSLTVYTLLGKEVIRLIDVNQSTGAHRVEWDASDRYGQKVASGIYIYKLEPVGSSHRFVQSRKMVLIR